MRAREFVKEEASSGATVAGGMALVSQPLGSTLSRLGSLSPAKYANSLNKGKGKKKHVSR